MNFIHSPQKINIYKIIRDDFEEVFIVTNMCLLKITLAPWYIAREILTIFVLCVIYSEIFGLFFLEHLKFGIKLSVFGLINTL